MRVRLRNMSELKDKHEQINQMLQSQQMESGHFGTAGTSNKSTAVEAERMRQQVQQMELHQMNLKHQNEEIQTILRLKEGELAEVKQELMRNEQAFNRLKNDMQLAKVGLIGYSSTDHNDANNNHNIDKLSNIIIDQRNKTKFLQGLLIRAKEDFDKLKQHKGAAQDIKNASNTTDKSKMMSKSDEILKTNEKLRQDHQQAIMVLIDLKEEYTTKLQIFAEKHQHQLSKIKSENSTLLKRIDHLQTQLTYMEKKEIRLYSQLEEARQLQEDENKEKDQRTKELEELLFTKEEIINELEREIKTKEKTIQDRQEQIGVLIASLENEYSPDESRQKLLNMTAEMCSIKAIQAQTERKYNELQHQFKKSELNNLKLNKQIEQSRNKCNEFVSTNKKLEKTLKEQIEMVKQQQIINDEKEREINELKFLCERHELQAQLNDESKQQMRDQLRRQETLFKDEIERIRKDIFDKVNTVGVYSNNNYNATISKGVINNDSMLLGSSTNNHLVNRQGLQFKTALQQLHVILAEYLTHASQQLQHIQHQNSNYSNIEQQNNSSNNLNDSKHLIQEFERALQSAASHIERLQQDLDKSNKLQAIYKSDLKASALNKMLIAQNESLQIKLQKFHTTMSQREEQREQYIKSSQAQLQKLVRDSELRVQVLTQENNDMESELLQLRSDLRQVKDQKEELEQSLFMFEQEQEVKRQAMERKAELSVDERFKAKHESVKAYFDSNITRILLNSQSTTNDKIVEMGREIVAQKLLVEKLHSQIDIAILEQQALDFNLSHYKELCSNYEQRLRDLQKQLAKSQGQLYNQDMKTKIEIEKKKQEIINLEKDLLRMRDQVEQKTRECVQLQNSINQTDQKNHLSNENLLCQDKLQEQVLFKDSQIQQLNQQIEDIQEKLVESHTQHINELDELKVQYDLELSEQRRNLQKEKEQLEKKFMPGYAPGDLMEHNQELQNRIIDLKNAIDRIMQENVIIRKKCESEKLHNESQRNEINGYKQALLELESTMVEMTTAGQSQIKDHMRSTISKCQDDKKKLKVASNKKKGQLHFNKDAYQSESEQYSHSKINHNEQSSLNVSALTSVNVIQVSTLQRPSTSTANYTI